MLLGVTQVDAELRATFAAALPTFLNAADFAVAARGPNAGEIDAALAACRAGKKKKRRRFSKMSIVQGQTYQSYSVVPGEQRGGKAKRCFTQRQRDWGHDEWTTERET